MWNQNQMGRGVQNQQYPNQQQFNNQMMQPNQMMGNMNMMGRGNMMNPMMNQQMGRGMPQSGNMMMNQMNPMMNQQQQGGMMMNRNMMMNIPQMNQQQPQQMQQQNMMMQQPQQQNVGMMNVPQMSQQPSQAQSLPNPNNVQYMNPEEIPLYPVPRSELVYPQPQAFQPPTFNLSSLPPELQQDIQQNQQRMSSESLRPLEELTGQKWYFHADYNHLISNKAVNQEQKKMLCSLICGNRAPPHGGGILEEWIKCIISWFHQISNVSTVLDPRYFVKKFMDACYTRHFTIRWLPPSREIKDVELMKKNSTAGIFKFEQGVCVIHLSTGLGDKWVWCTLKDHFAKPTGSATMGGRGRARRIVSVSKDDVACAPYPFQSIEGGLDQYGCIESQLYYNEHLITKYRSCQEMLRNTFGCEFRFEVDPHKIFARYMEAVRDPMINVPMVSNFWLGNYVESRQYCRGTLFGYIQKMVKLLVGCVTCNGSVDPKLVSAVLQKIPTKTLQIVYQPKEERSGGEVYYDLEYRDGKCVVVVHKYNTNRSIMFQPSNHKPCLENTILVEGIPILAYKNYHEKALPMERKAIERLRNLTGKEWKCEYKLPLTYKKLKSSLPNKHLEYNERFPSVLVEYFVKCVDRICEVAKKIEQLGGGSEQQQQQPQEEDEELDSDEEEEVRNEEQLSGQRKKFPTTIQHILSSSIPSHTINVKFLTKIKNPLERYAFCELAKDKLVVKIIMWNTNVNLLLRESQKTSFGRIMKVDGCPLYVYMDYFQKFAEEEVKLLEKMERLLHARWTFDYDLRKLYEGLEHEISRGQRVENYLRQVGYQFGQYFKSFVDVLERKMNEDERGKFCRKFGRKKMVRLEHLPGKERGYMKCVDEDGVLCLKVFKWMVNVDSEIAKLKNLL